MSLAATVTAMAAAGCTAQQIAAVVEAHEAAVNSTKVEKRAKDAARKRAQRERDAASAMSRGHDVTSRDNDGHGVTGTDIAGQCVTEQDAALAEQEPKTQEISYPKTPLKGVKKGEVLAPAAKPRSTNAECLTELGKVLDQSHAQAVLDHRNRIRKPMTPHAASLLAKSLSQASDPNAAADEMIERGWQGWRPDWGRSQGPPGRVRENSLLNGLEEFEQRFGSSNVQQFPRIAG